MLNVAFAMSLAPDEGEVEESEEYQEDPDCSEDALLSKAIAMSLAEDNKENCSNVDDDALLSQAIALSMQAFDN